MKLLYLMTMIGTMMACPPSLAGGATKEESGSFRHSGYRPRGRSPMCFLLISDNSEEMKTRSDRHVLRNTFIYRQLRI